MKNNYFKMRIVLLFFTSLFLISCEKDDIDPDVLPAATQIGANTGGALFNGKVWVAKKIDQYNASNKYFTELRKNGNVEEMIITLQNYNDPSGKVFSMTLKDNVIKEGTYSLTFNTTASAWYYDSEIYSPFQPYGSVTVTKLDRNLRIISGTFNLKVVNVAGYEIDITQGRFDKRFYLEP